MSIDIVEEGSYYKITQCMTIIRFDKMYMLLLVNNRNCSDEQFISASKQVLLKESNESCKLLMDALKGVRYWYLKQCMKEKESSVLLDLLSPLLEPLLVESKVHNVILTLIYRESIVNNSVVIFALSFGPLLFYINKTQLYCLMNG